MHRQCYEYAKQGLRYGDLCDNIGLVGVSAKWSYVTASPNHHDKFRRLFDLLVSPPFLVLFRQVATRVYMYNYYPKPALLPLLHPCPHCSSTMRFVTKKTNMASFFSVCILLLLHIEHHYCDDCIYMKTMCIPSFVFIGCCAHLYP